LGVASRINYFATAENYGDFEKVAVKENVCTCLFAKNCIANTWPCFKVLSKMCPTISVLLECWTSWTSNMNTMAAWGSKSLQETLEDVRVSVVFPTDFVHLGQTEAMTLSCCVVCADDYWVFHHFPKVC